MDGSGEMVGLRAKNILVKGKDDLVKDGGLNQVDELEVRDLLGVCFFSVVVDDEVGVRWSDLWWWGSRADDWLIGADALVLGCW